MFKKILFLPLLFPVCFAMENLDESRLFADKVHTRLVSCNSKEEKLKALDDELNSFLKKMLKTTSDSEFDSYNGLPSYQPLISEKSHKANEIVPATIRPNFEIRLNEQNIIRLKNVLNQHFYNNQNMFGLEDIKKDYIRVSVYDWRRMSWQSNQMGFFKLYTCDISFVDLLKTMNISRDYINLIEIDDLRKCLYKSPRNIINKK